MEAQQFWEFLVNAALFYMAYKLGQLSVRVQMNMDQRSEIQAKLAQVRSTGQRPTITVEEINGVFYAYDGNDFLAQGITPDELGKLIAKRYPNKYHIAKIEIKA